VYVPWGGGGLCCGIAAVMKALKPGVRVCAVEVETAAPLAASRKAGGPVTNAAVRSFVDGIGGKGVAAEMWPLAESLVDDVAVVSLAKIADAIRLLAERNRVIAEGAGGAAVAAALRHTGTGAVAIVSGGNIDSQKLAAILDGRLPEEHT
jgi:threonine dehydratase